MIVKIDSPVLIPKILKLAEKMDKVEVDVLQNMLTQGLSRDDSMILIEQKDDEIRGFFYATTDYMNGELVVFVQACFIEPDAPQAGHEMLNKVRNWGGKKGLRYIYFMTKRESDGWERKYKFVTVSHLLRRRI